MLEYGYEYGDADYKEADSVTEAPPGAGAAGARTEVKPARRSPPAVPSAALAPAALSPPGARGPAAVTSVGGSCPAGTAPWAL